MKITKKQLQRIINEELMAETVESVVITALTNGDVKAAASALHTEFGDNADVFFDEMRSMLSRDHSIDGSTLNSVENELYNLRKASSPDSLNEGEFAATAEEEAKKINAQTGIRLQTDQAYWEESGISTGEELALSLLHSNYSDTYKSIHGIRPRWAKFDTVEEVQKALCELDQEVEEMIAAEELDRQQQAEYEKKQKEMQALMPTEYECRITRDFPKQAGFGKTKRKRMPQIPRSTDPAAYGYTGESAGKLTKSRLRQIIKEELTNVLKEDWDKKGDGSYEKTDLLVMRKYVISPKGGQWQWWVEEPDDDGSWEVAFSSASRDISLFNSVEEAKEDINRAGYKI
jgi:hypothetical protein